MSVTQYIGARYVPLFAEPAEWSNDRTYEPLTIVLHQGNSYTSRQFVPRGIDIENADFWAETGNYNAQVEQYRQEVLTFGGRMDAVESAVTTETNRATAAEQANADAISAEVTRAKAAEQASSDAISAEAARATAAEQANADAISAETARATAADTQIRADFAAADSLINENVSAQSNILHKIMRYGQKVVIFSDSTFQDNSDPRSGVSHKSVATFIAEKTDANVVNLGQGGYTTQDILDQMNGMSPSEISDADYVIIASGTNDWQGGLVPVPIVNEGNCFELVYENTVKKAQTLAPTAQIICVTPAYVHSDAASDALNMNNTGNTFKAYCDVIAHVAHMLNVAVLRLDEMVGINEYNYTQKMLPSGAAGSAWANIWVHYAETTNDKISDMLAYGMYATNANAPDSGVTDVTPAGWYDGPDVSGESITYYGYNDLPSINVKKSDGLTTPPLMSGVEYWLSFRGPLKVTIGNNVVCDTTNQCVSMFPIVGNGNPVNIHIENSTHPEWNDADIIGPKLTMGRPNIYDAGKKVIGYKNKSYTNSTWAMRVSKIFANTNVKIESRQNFTMPSNQTEPFPILPATGLRGQVSGVCVNSSALWANIVCRIDGDGKMYLNEVPDGFAGSTITTCALFGVAF